MRLFVWMEPCLIFYFEFNLGIYTIIQLQCFLSFRILLDPKFDSTYFLILSVYAKNILLLVIVTSCKYGKYLFILLTVLFVLYQSLTA